MGRLFTEETRRSGVSVLPILCLLCFGFSANGGELSTANPIGKMARLFNPRLVKVEERVEFLNRQLMSLAEQSEHEMKYGIGVRGVRMRPEDPDPSITIDLGKEHSIEALYLVPLQKEFSESRSLFPRKFTIEFSSREDFSQRRVLFKSGDRPFPETGGKPVKFAGQGAMARYVRLTVGQGHLRDSSEIFALSEFVVISQGYPVSFGKAVSAIGTLNTSELWYPEAVVDGRMPLGIWHSGSWVRKEEKGDLVVCEGDQNQASWTMDLGATAKLDMVVLYPLEIRSIFEADVVPEKIEVQVRKDDSEEFVTVSFWENPVAGSDHDTPVVLPLDGILASSIRIRGLEPRNVGEQRIFGLSEIEVWSNYENIAKDLLVHRESGDRPAELKSLTNGFSSIRNLIPVGSWLNQLHERWRVEREIEALQPMRVQMAAESELNATWGSAMMLGLTFLIPVFIVERRRLISKNQVDELRKRIASDLHDDIGSNLGSISLIARTARKDLVRLHGPEEVAGDLNEVESIARESSLAMRDIVWLLERKQDSIGDLVSRMRETASRLLREVEYTIECDSTKGAAKLSLDAKRHLFLFYKEAVHNILKHSHATKVSIRLWDQGDKLALEVIDNGRGIPTENQDGAEVPRLIRKLDERARVLEGDFKMKSDKDTGTRVLLTVKRSHLIASQATAK